MAGIQPEHAVLSQVTNYTASLQRYREYAATTLSTWPAMWAELSKRRWSNAWFRLYGGKQRTVAKFWAEPGQLCPHQRGAGPGRVLQEHSYNLVPAFVPAFYRPCPIGLKI
ncbi:uncharacterized protein HaLaN_32635 [Haematococcus lacustris]|uniref:Uncharacterized protein n=1 Tax=Haematococcus lacustris TaxID=44745 RepID=A0A6A0ANF9_HAELA|nr:uncharacterized protein HaLaN_32635 [Haematococcus lacustris]